MNKLSEAQTYFNKNNPQSVELENVVCIFEAEFILMFDIKIFFLYVEYPLLEWNLKT